MDGQFQGWCDRANLKVGGRKSGERGRGGREEGRRREKWEGGREEKRGVRGREGGERGGKERREVLGRSVDSSLYMYGRKLCCCREERRKGLAYFVLSSYVHCKHEGLKG